MQCVILAGGLGTRMARFTAATPKALIPVGGEPFLRHKLRQLGDNGIDDVILATGHLGEQIEAEVSSHHPEGMRVRCVPDGPDLLGTAGSLRRLSDMELLDDVFMLTYGDSYLTCDHAEVARAFDRDRFDGLMTVWSVSGTSESGNCAFDGDVVISYQKGGDVADLGWIDYGLSVLTRSALDESVPPGAAADLAAVFGRLAASRRLQAFPVTERYHEIGSEEGLQELDGILGGSQR